jgi:hypothetical protein
MKDRKEYDRIRYALKRELKIDKTGVEPRTYKRFNPTEYGSVGCNNKSIDDIDNFKMTGGSLNVEPVVIQKVYSPEIQQQLDCAKMYYSPESYQNLLKMLG